MDDGERGAADESEPAEDDSGEEDAEERKAASKRFVLLYFPAVTFQLPDPVCSAEVALDRRDEMDVPGWKVGDPCVVLHSDHSSFDRER